MIKLSIIVPVYNVELYLPKCIDSLLNQDLKPEEYEIILVDDGSTDASGKIADAYASKHPNIHVLHQVNQGVSTARNNAITMARGKFVQFVDADDYLMPNVLNFMIRKMEQDKLEVLRFNYQFVNEDGNQINPNKYGNADNYHDEICDGMTFLNERLGTGCYAWQFVLTHELTRIQFMRGIAMGEDTDWTIRMLLETKRITSVDIVVYNYFVRNDSATFNPSPEKIRKRMEDELWIIQRIQNYQLPASNQLWFGGMIANTVIGLLTSVSLYCYAEREDYIRQLRELKVFPLSSYLLTPAARRKRLFINLSPRLFCLLMHISSQREK